MVKRTNPFTLGEILLFALMILIVTIVILAYLR